MKTVTVDTNLERFLASLTEESIFLSAGGKVLGRFTPHALAEESLYARACTLFDPAATERILAEQQGQGSSLSDIWARIFATETSRP